MKPESAYRLIDSIEARQDEPAKSAAAEQRKDVRQDEGGRPIKEIKHEEKGRLRKEIKAGQQEKGGTWVGASPKLETKMKTVAAKVRNGSPDAVGMPHQKRQMPEAPKMKETLLRIAQELRSLAETAKGRDELLQIAQRVTYIAEGQVRIEAPVPVPAQGGEKPRVSAESQLDTSVRGLREVRPRTMTESGSEGSPQTPEETPRMGPKSQTHTPLRGPREAGSRTGTSSGSEGSPRARHEGRPTTGAEPASEGLLLGGWKQVLQGGAVGRQQDESKRTGRLDERRRAG
jgi:hypothetical protein